MKRKVIVFAIIAAALVGAAAYARYRWNQMWRPYGDRGPVYDTKEISNGTFNVRITARHETGVYLGGAYYIFETAPPNSNAWREFVWLRMDDPHPIPDGLFQFVSNSIGYTHTGYKYVVTLDAGGTWNYWEPDKSLPPDWQYSFRYIKDVRIEPNGTGVLHLYPFPDKNTKVPNLKTKDYGQHWTVATDEI